MAKLKRLASAARAANEVFVSVKGAAEGVTVENTGSESWMSLRYYGPNAQPSAPNVGDHHQR